MKMDPPVTMNSSDEKSQTVLTSDSSSKSDVNTVNPKPVPIIIIDSSSNGNNTPATPSSPTDKNSSIESDPNAFSRMPEQEDKSTIPSIAPSTTTPGEQRNSQLLDEIKYLLKPTNSLANPDSTIQASQETDASIKRRTIQFDEDMLRETDRLLIEGLTPTEAKSLGAAKRRSVASRGQRTSYINTVHDRTRASSVQPAIYSRSQSQPATPNSVIEPTHRTLLDHLSDLMWIFFAAYSFSIILFLTDKFEIDLIFGFFLQMIIQTIAFGVYAFYKGYNLLEPSEHRIAMIGRSILIGIGVLTAFLAYYYITLPNLSAIRQSQVILTIILSMFFLRERISIPRILAFILTCIAILVLTHRAKFSETETTEYNTTNYKNSWLPYSSSWNYIIGINLALFTAILHSIASVINKAYFSTEQIHDTVVCFWTALSTLVISSILVFITHFILKDARTFPHDWRLYTAFGLAILSIFAFVANQKAIRRERSSIVTLIYSTDIILALILQNLFTQFANDAVIILGCVLVLVSVFIICIEMFIVEKSRIIIAVKVAEVANASAQNDDIQNRTGLPSQHQRVSV
ncbi:hypothetical protein I4U23_017955 [Adineta vaga]|nr:hypothetical protein I4U23_017955 [Adineta vaga]